MIQYARVILTELVRGVDVIVQVTTDQPDKLDPTQDFTVYRQDHSIIRTVKYSNLDAETCREIARRFNNIAKDIERNEAG